MSYPPGVTGHEDHIAGPRSEREFDDVRECGDCLGHFEVTIEETEWSSGTFQTWECPECAYENSEDVSDWKE